MTAKKIKIMNVPNMVTFYRLAVLPVVFVLFYNDDIIIDQITTTWVNVFLVFLAGISDYVDGYLARKMEQSSLLGKFLDSSTDKVFVSVMFVILIAVDRIDGLWVIPVILILFREFLISGVREFMAHHDFIVPVSWMGKWKLAFQLLAVGFYTAIPYGDMLIPYSLEIGQGLLIIATFMTVVSGYDYVRGALKALRENNLT